jgi:hypothetical protein
VGVGVAATLAFSAFLSWQRGPTATQLSEASLPPAAMARLDALDAAVADLRGQDLKSVPAASAVDLSTIVARLDTIEGQLAALDPTTPEVSAEPVDLVKMREDYIARMKEEVQTTVNPVSLGDTHARETGKSDWGASATEQITWASAESTFFSEHGGRVQADCRETSCEVAWSLPERPDLSEAEYDQLLQMAEYELMALAMQNAADPGQMEAIQDFDGEEPRIVVYLRRDQ